MPKRKDERTRNWTFVLYPESAPENWRVILDDMHVLWVESPLHDRDMNEDGTPKKAHYHILISFEGNKSYEQIKEITDALCQPIPIPCQSPKGLVRYMIHLDNPEKYQYDRSKIIGHGGADIQELLKPTSSNRYKLIKEMIEYVEENDIIYFAQLLKYASCYRFDDWFPLLCDNSAFIITSHIKSRRDRIKDIADEEFKNAQNDAISKWSCTAAQTED